MRVGNAARWPLGWENFECKIDGSLDSGDVTESNSHKHFGGLQVFVNKAHIAHKSKMQTSISVSMAKGELIAACEAVQIMLFSMLTFLISGI